jgi:hypothetical protein
METIRKLRLHNDSGMSQLHVPPLLITFNPRAAIAQTLGLEDLEIGNSG